MTTIDYNHQNSFSFLHSYLNLSIPQGLKSNSLNIQKKNSSGCSKMTVSFNFRIAPWDCFDDAIIVILLATLNQDTPFLPTGTGRRTCLTCS